MRKRNVSHIADTVFWYAVYMFPLIISVVLSFGALSGWTFNDWIDIYNAWGLGDFDITNVLNGVLYQLGFLGDGIIFNTLRDIFGYDGILPLVFNNGDTFFAYFSYFITCYLIHLCVDFILFIPRIAHKWLKKATEED